MAIAMSIEIDVSIAKRARNFESYVKVTIMAEV